MNTLNYDDVAEPQDDLEFEASCGHPDLVPAYVDPDAAAAWVEENVAHRLCRLCWLDRQSPALTDFDANHELPALRGSEKQVLWARKIRMDMITDIGQRIHLTHDLGKKTQHKILLKTLKGIQGVTDAGLWIEFRHFSPEAFKENLTRMMRAMYFRRAKVQS